MLCPWATPVAVKVIDNGAGPFEMFALRPVQASVTTRVGGGVGVGVGESVGVVGVGVDVELGVGVGIGEGVGVVGVGVGLGVTHEPVPPNSAPPIYLVLSLF